MIGHLSGVHGQVLAAQGRLQAKSRCWVEWLARCTGRAEHYRQRCRDEGVKRQGKQEDGPHVGRGTTRWVAVHGTILEQTGRSRG